jgi:hypothetical protein
VGSIARIFDDVALRREFPFQNAANIQTDCVVSTDFVAYPDYENL